MNTRAASLTLILVLGIAMLLPAAYGQEENRKPEAYDAVAMGVGGSMGGKTVSFQFKIDQFTPDEQVDGLAALLKKDGQSALRGALEKLDVGRIRPDTGVGNDIAVARKRKDGANTVITIVTARIMNFGELYRSGRSVDYPFGYLQVKLNAEGKGSGKIFPAASIRFNKKKGHFEIESYGNSEYIRAVNVRPQK